LALYQSFVKQGGFVKSVTIYLSDLGKEKIEQVSILITKKKKKHE